MAKSHLQSRGKRHRVSTVSSPMGGAGLVAGADVAADDAQVVAAQESQRQANDLTATFEAITDLVIVFDAAGHVQRINQATHDFMGRHATLAAGRQELGLTDAQGQPFPPDQWASTRVLRGETLTGDRAVDMLARTDTGREMLFSVSGAPVRDSQGRITGGVIVLRDVTERRRLERRTQEALQALLQMAETLVSPPPEPVPTHRAGGAVTSPALNPVAQRLADLTRRVLGCGRVGIVALEAGRDVMHPMALTGLPSEQAFAWCAGLEGRSMAEFVGADRMRRLRAGEAVELDLEWQPLCSVAHGGPVALAVPLRLGDQLVGALALGYEQETHIYTPDDLALAEAVGQLTAVVIERERLLREREEAQASTLALREANRRMQEFLGIASHELRTPLTSLLGDVQVVERRLARTPPAGRPAEELAAQLAMVLTALERMERQGWQLSRLVSDLVEASRSNTNQLELQRRACDLAAIVRDAVEEQRRAQPRRAIDLAPPADTGVPLMADADRLGQVVTNYLTNALKYSDESEPVEVLLRVEGDMARVSVRDHGPGLAPEEQHRVWDLFYRAPGVAVQSGSGIGLGLGLHICKTIIERHSGQVGIESAAGQGATFWFTVPLAASASATADAASSP